MTITDEMVSVAQQAASSHAWPHSQFRAALEAAAPLIRAAVIEECAKEVDNSPDRGISYRSIWRISARVRALARSKTDE